MTALLQFIQYNFQQILRLGFAFLKGEILVCLLLAYGIGTTLFVGRQSKIFLRKAKIVQLWEERRRSGECTYKQIVVNSSLIDHRNVFLHEKYESIVLAWKKGDFAWCLRLAPQRLSLMQFPLCPSFHEQSSKLHLSNSKQTPKHKNCWAHYISYLTQQKICPENDLGKTKKAKENVRNDTKVTTLQKHLGFEFSR